MYKKIITPLKITALTGLSLLVGCSSNAPQKTQDNALTKTSVPQALRLKNIPHIPSPHWKMVWNDEFNDSTIDPKKWSFEENCWGGGNNEQQCYTHRKSNAYIKDGKLNIVAKKGHFTGSASPDGKSSKTKSLPYTSARLRTMNKGDWKYGRIEVRAKLPSGQGTWPAIWMLPTDWVYGNWAASGEIDIMESVNLKTPSTETGAKSGDLESRVFGTLHYGRNWPNNVFTGQATHLPDNANPADDYHTYAIEWEKGEIRWYIDGVHYATQKSDGWYSQSVKDGVITSNGPEAPFNQKFHLLLNVAVGGNWAANANLGGIDASVFPQTMSVDYVRVYQCSINPITGKGCKTDAPKDQTKLVKGIAEPEVVQKKTSHTKIY